MRHAFLLLPVLASFALSVQPADACGPYGGSPQLLQLSTHYATEGTRMFALTTEEVTGDHAWVRLAPGTYDNTSVVDVADPAHERAFTLVGPKGATIVSSRKRFFLKNSFLSRAPAVAFELAANRADHAIALAGKHADARWTERAQRAVVPADRAWLRRQDLNVDSRTFVEAHTLTGTDFELLTVILPSGLTTMVRRGDTLHSRIEGHVSGAVSVDGEQFLVVHDADHGPARAVRF